MYLQQFHLSIKYKKGTTNHVINYLSWPLVVVLTTIHDSCGHETSELPQLYDNDLDFTVTYQTLSTGKQVLEFHLQDALFSYLDHIFVPSNKSEKLIWEAHYGSMEGNFSVEKIIAILQKKIY